MPKRPPRNTKLSRAEVDSQLAKGRAAAAEARPRLPGGKLPKPRRAPAAPVEPASQIVANIIRDATRAEPFLPPPVPSVVEEMRFRSLEQQRDVLERTIWEEERALAREDYWYFVTEVMFPTTWPKHYTEALHRPLCLKTQSLTKAQSLWGVLPRKRRKSHILHMLRAIWRIIKDPNIRILSVGAREETVGPFARWVRDAFIRASNPAFGKFQRLFPEFMLEPTGRNLRQAFQFTVPNRTMALADPTFRAAYLGVTGAGWRCDELYLDDPVERRNVTTPEMAQKTFVRIMDLYPLLDDTGEYQNILGMATRWAYFDPLSHIIGEAEDADSIGEEALARLKARQTEVIVRHALEDPARLCEACPKHIVLANPHGHPSIDSGESIDDPVHTKQQVLDELEQYRVNPSEGESQFWHQLMNVCLAPSAQKFQREWFVTLTEPTWRDTRRKVLSIDSADKNFQTPGIGDYMVALFGDWSERGKLCLVYGLRSNRWTREDFIRQILAWCIKTRWWPNLVAKEKFGTDNFLTQLGDAFLSQGQPVRPVIISRPQGLKKNDWIVDSLQAPLERGEVVCGSAFPRDLFERLVTECVSLGQVANEDVADCLATQMTPGVRVAAVDRLVAPPKQWTPPALDLYDAGLVAQPRQQLRISPASPFEDALAKASASILEIGAEDDYVASEGRPQPQRFQVGLDD